jgi:uncharacterized protein (TIGR02001 family)
MNTISKLTLLSGLAMASAGVYAADEAPKAPYTLTGNGGLYSQYIFRGLTQTNEKPAFQGGIDYAHTNGFYAGNWNSNVSWLSDTAQTLGVGPVSASLESDFYGGYKGSITDDIPYDLGFLRYQYWGSYAGLTKPDTNEIYASIGYKWATLKYSYSLGDTFAVADAKGSDYVELNFSVPVAKWTFAAHVGKQRYKGPNRANLDYNDYKLGASYDLGDGYSLGVAGTNSNAKDAGYTLLGKNIGKSQFVVNVGKTF